MMRKIRWIALLVVLATVLALFPVSVFASTNPATVTVAQAEERLEKLIELFEGKFFTVNQTYCVIGSHSSDCDNCNMSKVVATNWCKNLVGMGTLDYSLFPAQYNYDGVKWSVNGWQCYGFANFAHWYIFAQKNTDNLVSTLETKGAMTHATMKKARPGDVIRTNWLGGHSMVFISCDSSGFTVLDCNYKDASCQQACKVRVHKVSYNSSYQVAITGVENYDRNNTYTISYNANGGTGVPSAQTKTQGKALTLSATVPTRAGYTFAGWATSSTGAVAYQAGGSYTTDAAATLYAVWTPDKYSVNYDANGGTGAPAAQTKTHGQALTLSDTVPTRSGYTFKSWTTSPNGGQEFQPGSSFALDEAVTLYALWQPVKYLIFYEGNGGVGAPEAINKIHGEPVVLSSSAPTREGYIFMGWATSANGGVVYRPGDSYTSDESVSLYAVWEKNQQEGGNVVLDPTTPAIVMSSGTGITGKQISVTVSLKNNPGLASMMLTVGYDPAVLTLLSVTDSGNLGTAVHSDILSAQPYTLTWANDLAKENYTYNGEIVTLTFQVAENAKLDQTTVTVSYDYDNYDIFDVSGEPVRFVTVSGAVNVIDVMIGDVNSDGLVNTQDRMILTRYLAQWADYPESSINLTAADVNCDGRVNTQDRMILTRYLAKWEGYSQLPYTG